MVEPRRPKRFTVVNVKKFKGDDKCEHQQEKLDTCKDVYFLQDEWMIKK